MIKIKKPIKNFVDREEFWIGMSVMIAAGSNSSRGQGCVITDSSYNLVSMAFDDPPLSRLKNSDHVIHAAINASMKASNLYAYVAFVNHTPCYNCIMALLSCDVKEINYIKTVEPDAKTINLIESACIGFHEFTGSLSWMKDCVKNFPAF